MLLVVKHGFHKSDDFYDVHSREEDDKRLAPVADWFHEEVAMIHHNDPRLRLVDKHALELSKELPIRAGADAPYHMRNIAIPNDVDDHINRLLKCRA